MVQRNRDTVVAALYPIRIDPCESVSKGLLVRRCPGPGRSRCPLRWSRAPLPPRWEGAVRRPGEAAGRPAKRCGRGFCGSKSLRMASVGPTARPGAWGTGAQAAGRGATEGRRVGARARVRERQGGREPLQITIERGLPCRSNAWRGLPLLGVGVLRAVAFTPASAWPATSGWWPSVTW